MNDSIICLNKSAQEFLGKTETELLGNETLGGLFRKPGNCSSRQTALDLTQTLRMDRQQCL